MARIAGVSEQDASPETLAVYERVKARFGKLLEPVTIAANHPEIFRAYTSYEGCFRGASRVDTKLKELAMLKIATLVGCQFCIDFGSAEAKKNGITERQMQALPRHGESSEFSDAEKLVLDFAEAMTQIPVNVTDSLYTQLQTLFDPVQVVEITATIAWENYRSRFNHALRIESHGFSVGHYCAIALPTNG